MQLNCTYDLVAKIGIQENLRDNADSADDPVVELRFGATSGSQNQALDCEPPNYSVPSKDNLAEEIALGCAPEYTRNNGTPCPAPQLSSGEARSHGIASPWRRETRPGRSSRG